MYPNKCLIRIVLCLCLLGATACSSDGSGGSSDLSVIEANLEIVMSAVVGIIQALEPFPPPTPELGGGGECLEIPDNADICTDSGNILDCGSGLFTINNCAASEGPVSILVGGSLTFTMGVEWPTGTRNLSLDAPGLAADYVITFDGSDTADVLYSDADVDAVCTVLLEPTVDASCTLVE